MGKEEYCEDCGCILWDGRCPNCDEEQVIYEDQISEMSDKEFAECFPNGLSKPFLEKVEEQQRRNASGYRD